MTSCRALGILPLFLLIFSSLPGQQDLFDIQTINVEDGLPHRRTYRVVEDLNGFIWVSTSGNISRYNGYHFKNYNSSFLNIVEGNFSSLAVDKNNHLWYSEFNHLSLNTHNSGIINTSQDKTFSIQDLSKGLVKDKVAYVSNSKSNKNDVIIATATGIVYKYNGSFEEIYRFPTLKSGFIQCEQAPNGDYWFFNDLRAFRFNQQKKLDTFKLHSNVIEVVRFLPSLIVKLQDVTTITTFLELKGDNFVPFLPKNTPKKDDLFFLFLRNNALCYSTDNELFIQNEEGEHIVRTKIKTFNADGLTKFHSSYLDQQGIYWLCSENGLLKITQTNNPFTLLHPTNSARGIYVHDDSLWMGGYTESICNERVKEIQSNTATTFGLIMNFHKSADNHIWIGTSTKWLIEYIPEKDTAIIYNTVEKSELVVPFKNPYTKSVWIGTTKGLLRLEKNTKNILPFQLPNSSSNHSIKYFHQNKAGIWIASDKGLFLMDNKKETLLKHYTSKDGLPFDDFNHIYEDAAGIFWLATKGGGLIRWNIEKNTFKQFQTEDGLSNNNVYAVYEDDYENLWLPSDYGLMRFDKNTHNTRIFLPQHGIAHEEFNTFSHFKDKDGTLYFGGLNGITKFNPNDMHQRNVSKVPLLITKLQVLENNEEEFKNKTKEFQATKSIQLNPSDKILELELSLLDFSQSSDNQYAYKVEGYQDYWIHSKDNKISIINLPYGKYNLILKGRGASGTWSESMQKIPLLVVAPFYLQWWFLFAMGFLLIGFTFAVVRWRLAKFKKDRDRLEMEVQKRTYQIEQDKQTIFAQSEKLQMLDKAKTRFFSNITHEFRTPLTLIIGPVQQLLTERPPSKVILKRLGGVLKNSQHLLSLINQLLDLSKLESGQMKVELKYGDLVKYTQELLERFKPLADKKNHRIAFVANKTGWKTNFDQDKWNKIIYNLMSNAIKFTPKGGAIQLSMGQIQKDEKEIIQITINDTGSGISPDRLTQVFDRFYQVDASTTRTQEGTGIGLSLVKELVELQGGNISVDSILGKGTSFHIELPVLQTEAVTVLPTSTASIDILDIPVLVDKEEKVETPTLLPNKPEKEKLELLIIEDNEEMRAYIRQCIDNDKYNIIEARDGEEGIQLAQMHIPDLIISDVMMPKKDGFQVTKAIRTHLSTSHIPLILLTAKAALHSRLKGIKHGADVYLTKPFSPEELTLRIRKLIEIRQLLQLRFRQVQPTSKTVEKETVNEVYNQEHEFLEKLKTYVLKNIRDENLNGDILSKHVNISRMQLYRKLKALTNQTITEFVKNIRLEFSRSLLFEKELNISEIAYESGFTSLSYYSRSFKKKYGKSPREIQKNDPMLN